MSLTFCSLISLAVWIFLLQRSLGTPCRDQEIPHWKDEQDKLFPFFFITTPSKWLSIHSLNDGSSFIAITLSLLWMMPLFNDATDRMPGVSKTSTLLIHIPHTRVQGRRHQSQCSTWKCLYYLVKPTLKLFWSENGIVPQWYLCMHNGRCQQILAQHTCL